MKYSFVISTRNNNEFLKNTLEALNYQHGFGHYNVILVDEGSSDYANVRGTNRNYELKYFHIERCRDSFGARARNYGWKQADGDIIVFIDSDIIVRPDYLDELDRCFGMSGDIAVIGNMLLPKTRIKYSDVTSCRIFKKNHFDSKKTNNLEFRHYLFEKTSYNINAIIDPWMKFNSCNAAIPKKWLEIIGGFDESFIGRGFEDIDLGYVLSDMKLQIVIDPKLEVIRQYHGKSNNFVINNENMEEYDRNMGLFLAKHPDALKLLSEAAYILSKGKISYKETLSDDGVRNIVLDFKEKKLLGDFKTMILKSLTKKNTLLIIQDYVEKTDLDIWLQLPKDNGIIKARYYPMSKRIDQKEADSFLRKNINTMRFLIQGRVD